MNIKKLFAVLAGVSMLANVVLPGLAEAATADAELQGAYEWAHSKSITTMSSFEAANMYGAITRAELAKMLANWAKDDGRTPDTSKACAFTDTASVKGDLATAIVEACQLGLMGQGITAFRPYDSISRAEFGTALSRALWGNKYEGGNPYYANHLNALKAAGIMNQIANAESTKEVRGYVMLMLQRSEGDTGSSSEASSTDCDDAAIALACKLGSDLCPAKCKAAEEEEDDVVRSGDLAVTAKAAAGRKVLANGAISDLDTLTFKTSEDIEITKITLEKYGYSDGAAVISGVWLEDADGNMITNEKPLGNKDQLTLSVKKDYRMVDGTMVATVVLRTNSGTGYVGGTIGFKVVSVESTAENEDLDLKNYTPYEYDLANYAGAGITLDDRGSDKDYNYVAGESYEIAKFKATAGDAALTIKGFTLTNASNQTKVDMNKYLEDLEVTIDGAAVKARYSVEKTTGYPITIAFDEIELGAKKSVTFAVKVTFSDDFTDYGKYLQYEIVNDADFSATEKKTGVRISTVTKIAGWVDHVMKGGKVKITNGSLDDTINAAAGSTEVLVAEGTIEVSETIKMPVITITGTANSGLYLEAARLIIAGEEYEATVTTPAATTALLTFNGVEIEKSGKVQLKIDIAKGATGSFTFNPNSLGKALFSGALYDETNSSVIYNDDVKGSITVSTVEIKTASATVEKKADSDNKVEYIVDTPARKVVFEGTYSVRKEDVKLNKFWFITGTNLPAGNDVEFYVFINGTEVGNTELFGEANAEEFDAILVKAGKTVSVKVEAYVSADTGATYSNIDLYLEGIDTSEDENASGRGNATLNEFEVKESGSVTIPAATIKNTALLKKSETTVAEFTVKPSNGNAGIKFKDIVLTGDNFTGNFRVKVAGVEYFDPTCDGTGCKYKINETLPTEGYVVTVIAKNAMTGNVDVTVVSVNDKPFGTTYSKYFAESLVSFVGQNEGSSSSTYTLSVRHYDDAYSISGFAVQIMSGSECTGAIIPVGNVVDGETFTIYRTEGKAQIICKATYDVYEGANKKQSVSIDKATYKDYFKVNGVELAVPAN